MQKIHLQENDLFAKWQKKRPGMIPDGVVDEDIYLSSKPRIVYLMKEANGGAEECLDLREYLKNGGCDRTWSHVARWTYGIRKLYQCQEIPLWEECCHIDEHFRKEQLRGIAIINLKKHCGSLVADPKLVTTYACEDQEFLQQQLALYEAELVICGGVGYPHSGLDWQQTSRGIVYANHGKTLVIQMHHPEVRCAPNYPFYMLLDALKEIKI